MGHADTPVELCLTQHTHTHTHLFVDLKKALFFSKSHDKSSLRKGGGTDYLKVFLSDLDLRVIRVKCSDCLASVSSLTSSPSTPTLPLSPSSQAINAEA